MLNKFIERVRQSHPSKIRDDILTISKVGEYDLSTQNNLACKPNDAFNWQVGHAFITLSLTLLS